MPDPISFLKDYIPTRFPIEARYYDLQRSDSMLSAQIIHSLQELQSFQQTVEQQDTAGHWIFLAYYPLPSSGLF